MQSRLLVGLALLLAPPAFAQTPPPLGLKLGGATSRPAAGADSFALPAANLPRDRAETFFAGQRLFNIAWVKAPAPGIDTAGLGPTFNRPSCGACHTRDGRGRPPDGPEDALNQSLVRLSVLRPTRRPMGAAHPNYGAQIQDRAIEGVPPEARVSIGWVESEGRYADGEAYRLRKPVIKVENGAFGSFDGAQFSLRVAPQLVGLGLLEAVPRESLIAYAQELRRRDIHGVVGSRFGWKGTVASVRDQIAIALHQDMGLTSAAFPEKNCPPAQTACRAADPGPRPNVSDAQLDALTFYVSTLAVPERRDIDNPAVKQGEKTFHALGCALCHRPTLRTGRHPAIPQLSGQTIHPFTDLLLHHMGPDMSDAFEGVVLPGQWRTAPLWGLGLVETVNGHLFLLHDGRARGFAEAILWHGGDAAPARDRFKALPKAEREALIAFLRSL